MNPADPELPTLRALNRRFIHNFVTRDVRSHDQLLHARFHAITALGTRMERAEYLAYWATAFDPALIVYWDMRDERIERFGSMACVSATNRWVRQQDGARLAGTTVYTDSYVQEEGRWLCVLAQMTTVAEAPAGSDDGIVVRYHAGVLDACLPGARR
jgi:hypothetical protein